MSRIGRLPVPVPAGVDVTVSGDTVTVKGPKGSIDVPVATPITVALQDGTVVVGRPDDERTSRALHGLTRSLIANAVDGVTKGYTKSLEIVGTGYRVQAKGKNLEFSLGYSHQILVEPPEGISFTAESATALTVHGIDKQQVGEVAAKLRKLRAPEPYKGKGVKYAGEQIRRKVGKAGK